MTYDGDDDLFDEEFDFVDEEDDDSEDDDSEDDVSEDEDSSVEDPSEDLSEDDEVEEKKPAARKKARPTKAKNSGKRKPKAADSDVVADESSAEASAKETSAETSAGTSSEEKTESEPEEVPEPPGPPTDHVVHLYEFGDFTRTIPREFTSEDAEAFAIEYNRTSSPHSRQAVAAGKDEEHAISVSQIRKAARG